MAKRKRKGLEKDTQTLETLKDLLIVELARAGVPQLEIRKIVGCDVHRVSRIVKYIKVRK